MKKKHIFIALITTIFVLLISSCIGIDNNITFNKDGSGIIKMEYRISKMFQEMGDNASEAPLPMSKENLESSLEEKPGIKLIKVSQKEDDKDVYISAEIKFDSIENLTALEEFSTMPMSLEKSGADYIFHQIISEGNNTGSQTTDDDTESNSSSKIDNDEAGTDTHMNNDSKGGFDDQSLAMMEPYFQGYELKFTVNTPSSIKSHNMGELSNNKRTLIYSISLIDMNSLKEKTILIVKW